MQLHMTASPHKIFLLVMSVVGGAIGVFDPGLIAPAVGAAIPPPYQIGWFAGLVTTSGVALWGSFKPCVAGLLAERVALIVQTVLLLAWTVAIVGVGVREYGSGLAAPMFYSGFAFANCSRAWIITRILAQAPTTPPDAT